MTERNYPTRMHEVLGVEPHEPFEVKGHDGNFILDSSGAVRFGKHFEHSAYSEFVAEIINYPERITRRPRLTEEQVAMLKAAWALGARYIAREGNSGLRLSDNAPIVLMGGRLKIADDNLTMYIESYSNPLVELVKQSDPEPLDIVQVLRENGCEVDDG